MKNTTHNSSVASVLPPLKRCWTGMPFNAGSSTIKRQPSAKAAFALTDVKSSATRASARPVSARKRTDSGSRQARIGTSTNGAAPPTINTDRQQGIHVVDERSDQRANAERQRRENDDFLAPDAIGQRAKQQRADHQAKQARTEHR